ncbi:MAG: RNA polymerase sigma factor [Kofleriaceae bacterium]
MEAAAPLPPPDRAQAPSDSPSALSSDPADDPITAMIRTGRHREAIAACARTHGAVLGRLGIALLGSQADADEACQETLLRAHRAMASYRGEGSVKAWLCGIARHVCAHMLESRRRSRELLELVPIEGEARDAFATRRRARAVRDALAKLKPTEREALVLRFVAELSHREIAATCNLDEAAARKRISRALAKLRSVMPEQELAP